MRVIAGNLKRKKIFLPEDNLTRPLRDLVKESIFNLINHSNKFHCTLNEAKVLDLFSGTGSFGIECISRKAKKVTFVENYKKVLSILLKNIKNLKIKEKVNIIEQDCFDFFNLGKVTDQKFDIIFIDPPFKEKKINLVINYIKKNKVLEKDGILIIHRHKKDNIKITDNLKILEERNYGISKIIISDLKIN